MEQVTHESATITAKRSATVTQRVQRAPVAWELVLRTGLNAGLILAGLNVVNWLAGLSAGGAFDAQALGGIFVNQTDVTFALLATCGLFLGRLALFFAVGHRVAARTGRAAQGAVAGMAAGAVDGVSGLVITLLGVVLFPMYTLSSGYAGTAQPVGNAVLLAVAETLALSVLGLLIGAVGGGTVESDRFTRVAENPASSKR